MIWFSCFCCASENFSSMPASLAARLDRLGVGGAPFALGADLGEAEDDLALRKGRKRQAGSERWPRRGFDVGYSCCVSLSGGAFMATLKRCTVVLWNVSPGRSTVDGNSGWFGRVGIVLRLQAHAVALPIGPALAAAQPAVEEVAGVELDAGLGGLDLHHPAARPGRQDGRRHQAGRADRHRSPSSGRSRARASAAGRRTDARGDRRRPRGSRTACRRPRRSPVGISVASTGRKRLAFSVSSWSSALPAAGEVVVAVVRQVDDRRPARRRAVVDAPFVRRRERVAHGRRRAGRGSARRRRRSSGSARARRCRRPARAGARSPTSACRSRPARHAARCAPSFSASWYGSPSSTKRPAAMRLP